MRKFIIQVCILIFSFLLFSCTTYVQDTDYDIEELAAKSSMKTFAQLNDPFVVRKGIVQKYHNIFSKNKIKREGLGAINVVIDWETDTIYDWIYSKEGGVYCRPIAIGQNPKKYYNYLGDSCFSCINPKETKIRIFKTKIPCCDYFYNYDTPGNYGMMYYNLLSSPWAIQIFDAEKEDMKEEIVYYENKYRINNNFRFASPDGSFWMLAKNEEDTIEICRLDGEEAKIESHPVNVSAFFDTIDFDDSDILIKSVYEDIGFIYWKTIKDDELYKRYIFSFNPDNCSEIVRYETNLEEGDYVHTIVRIENNFYAVTYNTNRDLVVHIYKIDPKLRKVSLYSNEESSFRYYWTPLVRENRIYLIDDEDGEISYLYFDVNTGKFSEVRQFLLDDIIRNK